MSFIVLCVLCVCVLCCVGVMVFNVPLPPLRIKSWVLPFMPHCLHVMGMVNIVGATAGDQAGNVP